MPQRRVLRRGEILGERIDGEVTDEAEHYIKCPCGGLVDMRDIAQVAGACRAAAAPGRGQGAVEAA